MAKEPDEDRQVKDCKDRVRDAPDRERARKREKQPWKLSQECGAETPIEQRSQPEPRVRLIDSLGSENNNDSGETRKGDGQLAYGLECSELLQIDALAALRIGVNRRGIAPPDSAEPEKVDGRTVQRQLEPRYSMSAFNGMLGGCWTDVGDHGKT